MRARRSLCDGYGSTRRPRPFGTTDAPCFVMLPERLSGVDAAWRRMDTSKQHATIVSLLVFDGHIERSALVGSVSRSIEKHERFRARVHDRGILGATWELDPEFDMNRHVTSAPPPRDARALRELISDLASEPFDPAHPLWQMVVTEWPGGGTAVISKIHHCLADGVALVRVLLGMTDEGTSITPPEVGWKPENPEQLEEKLRHLGREADTLAKTLLLPSDPPSVLRGSLGPRKVVAWSSALDLERIRAIGATVSGTINDALTAAIAGGIQRYARDRGRPLEHDVRAMVPVFLAGAHEQKSLGNAFGLVYAALPRIAEPRARLREAKARMDKIKSTPETSNAVAMLGLLGSLSPAVEQIGIRLFTAKASLVVTNVPGPPLPIHIMGVPLRSMTVWAPFAGDLALSVTAVSHRGELRLGVLSDANVIGHPEGLVDAIERDLAELSVLVEGDRAMAVAQR
ncbi:MAG: WS/DGAT domain-containing protein [Polyangiales bacterium]